MKLQQNRGRGPRCVCRAVIIRDSLTLVCTQRKERADLFYSSLSGSACLFLYNMYTCYFLVFILYAECVLYCDYVRGWGKQGRPTPPAALKHLLLVFLAIYEVPHSLSLPSISHHPPPRYPPSFSRAIPQILRSEADGACPGLRRGHHIVLIPGNISDQPDFIIVPLIPHMRGSELLRMILA